MKKVLYSLITIVMVLPLVVKADLQQPDIYYTENTIVGGTIEENIVFSDWVKSLKDFVIKYDSNYLSINEEDIKIFYLGEDNAKNGTIEISNGQITINIPELKSDIPETVVDWDLGVDSTKTYIELHFKALKSGETTISTGDTGFYGTYANISIIESNYSNETNNNVPSESNTTKTTDNNKKESSNNDIPLYISLGANVVLLGTTVFFLLKEKQKE